MKIAAVLVTLGGTVCAECALAQCQGVWVQMPVTGPPAHQDGAMSFDPSTQECLFLHPNGSAWTWNGLRWLDRTEPDQPPRPASSMCVDGLRPRVLLAGGQDGCCSSRPDAWVWEPGWAQVTPMPGSRLLGSMGHDPVSDTVIYFGGSVNSGISSSTFGWNGFSWTSLFPVQSPAARSMAAGATDPTRGRFMIFGGRGNGVNLNDLWEWDGSNWLTVPQPGPRPSIRDAAAAAGTPSGFFIFGGGTQDGSGPSRTNETWLFSSGQWSLLSTSGPSPRRSHAMAYDPVRGHVVLFGGRIADAFIISDETWVWSALPVLTSAPADVSTCPPGTATFSVTAAGTGPFNYQWQIADATVPGGWRDVEDGPIFIAGERHGSFSGATTNRGRWDGSSSDGSNPGYWSSDAFARCIVTNACGSVASRSATLAVCPADFNCDGGTDFFDYLDFVALFDFEDIGADFNGDMQIDFFDYLDFVAAFDAGC